MSGTSDVRRLLERCERVATDVRPCKGGATMFRFRNGTSIALPPPKQWKQRRTYINFLTKLRRLGLEEMEAQMAATPRTTTALAAPPRKTATRRTVKKVEPIAPPLPPALSRSRGIYPCDFEWLTTKHDEPQSCFMEITPEVAKVLSEPPYNTGNRRQSKSHGSSLRRAVSGSWLLMHQGIAFDRNGRFFDGQHRMLACSEMGVPIVVQVTVGLDPDVFLVTDENLARRAADIVALAGAPDPRVASAAVKLVYATYHEELDPNAKTLPLSERLRDKMSNIKTNELWHKYADELTISCAKGIETGRAARINQTGLSAAHFHISKANGYSNVYVEAFFRGLGTGRKLDGRMHIDDADPRESLRQLMEKKRDRNQRASGLDVLRLVIQAWNKVIQSDPKGMRTEPNRALRLPEIVRCYDRGPEASICPPFLIGELPE